MEQIHFITEIQNKIESLSINNSKQNKSLDINNIYKTNYLN